MTSELEIDVAKSQQRTIWHLRTRSADNFNLLWTDFERVFEGNRDYFVQLNGLLMGRNKTLPGVNFGSED